MSDLDEVYYRGPGPRVLCTVGVDTGRETDDGIAAGLDRARDDGQVVQLYAHIPGDTLPLDRLDAILAGARDRGLRSFTYAELAAGPPAEAGLALSFDDSAVGAWASIADRLDTYGIHVTFFVTRYHLMSEAERALLRDLHARGHDVEAHSVTHIRAPDYAEAHGLEGYLADEVRPEVEMLRADGYDPIVFAYPFGSRTPELDRALLREFSLVRSVTFSRDLVGVSDPCPE